MIIETAGWQMYAQSHAWSPPTDFYETEANYIVRVEIAGLHEQDFAVKLDRGTVIVSGVRSDVPERRAYRQMEIRFGEFIAAVAMPGPVDESMAHAEYEDGFLVVTLPKAVPTDISITGS
jgi:HSP20 family protein